MKKAIIIVAILFLGLVVLFSTAKKEVDLSDKPQITVSTFALYDISKKLLANNARVSMLIPFGVDIHSYEMTPQDRIRVQKSRFFIYSGAGLEPWTDDFASQKNAVDMSQYVKLRDVSHHDEHHHTSRHNFDPHYWLDIDNMIVLTKKLQELYSSSFPKEVAKSIATNAKNYIASLKNIDKLYKKRLHECKRDTIVVSHNAFGYLSARYGFHVMSLTGLSPDAMPSAKELAKLSDIVREKGIRVLFNEPFESNRLIESLAKETGARVDVLQPIANITKHEADDMVDYKLIMNLNLQKLYSALGC
jgi:zinc transport system substrate-binding protein